VDLSSVVVGGAVVYSRNLLLPWALPELLKLQPWVAVAKMPWEFVGAIERLLEEDLAERRQDRRAFARRNTWEARAETIASCILRKFWGRQERVASTPSM